MVLSKSKDTRNIVIYDINGYLKKNFYFCKKLPRTDKLKIADIGPFLSLKSRAIFVMKNYLHKIAETTDNFFRHQFTCDRHS